MRQLRVRSVPSGDVSTFGFDEACVHVSRPHAMILTAHRSSADIVEMTSVSCNLIRVRSASQSLGSVGDCGDSRNRVVLDPVSYGDTCFDVRVRAHRERVHLRRAVPNYMRHYIAPVDHLARVLSPARTIVSKGPCLPTSSAELAPRLYARASSGLSSRYFSIDSIAIWSAWRASSSLPN